MTYQHWWLILDTKGNENYPSKQTNCFLLLRYQLRHISCSEVDIYNLTSTRNRLAHYVIEARCRSECQVVNHAMKGAWCHVLGVLAFGSGDLKLDPRLQELSGLHFVINSGPCILHKSFVSATWYLHVAHCFMWQTLAGWVQSSRENKDTERQTCGGTLGGLYVSCACAVGAAHFRVYFTIYTTGMV